MVSKIEIEEYLDLAKEDAQERMSEEHLSPYTDDFLKGWEPLLVTI